MSSSNAQRPGEVVAAGRKFENAALTGTGAALAEIRSLEVARGRYVTRDEEARAAPVAVIGRDVAALYQSPMACQSYPV